MRTWQISRIPEVDRISQGPPVLTPPMLLEACPTPVLWDLLHPMAMVYSIWLGMCGSGVGTFMGRLMRVARIREGLRQALNAYPEVVVGTMARSAVGPLTGNGVVTIKHGATAILASGPSSLQVSELVRWKA